MHVKPFIVAVYCGKKKTDVDPFLKDLCEEINRILSNGITIDNKKFPVSIRAVIADAPAKAMIKQISGHGGYYACDRCFVKGIYDGSKRSISYSELCCEKGTNFNFRNKQPEHHIGESPFLSTNIDMVEKCPVDYMHAILLGIMRKLFKTWMNVVLYWCYII